MTAEAIVEAFEALTQELIALVRSANAGAITSDEVTARIAAARAQLSGQQAAEDAALAAKFPPPSQ